VNLLKTANTKKKKKNLKTEIMILRIEKGTSKIRLACYKRIEKEGERENKGIIHDAAKCGHMKRNRGH
jgi:hypothetical protein